MVGVAGPVRGMEVYRNVGVIFSHEANQRAGLWRIEFDMVSVKIESLSVGTLPHPTDRAVLPGPVA